MEKEIKVDVPVNATPEEARKIIGDAVSVTVDEIVKSMPHPAKTAGMSAEELGRVAATEEYNAFEAKADELSRALLKHIHKHTDEYGCAVVISIVTLAGKGIHRGTAGYAGTPGSVIECAHDLLRQRKIGPLLKDLVAEADGKEEASGEGEGA